MASPAGSRTNELRERRRERAAEPTRPDTRTVIIDTTERVLADVPLHDLTVAQLIAAASVSRGTFYSYFASKYEVVAALLERAMDEMYDVMRAFVEREDGGSREEVLRQVLMDSTQVWGRRRVVFRATHEHMHAVPELRDQWTSFMERFKDAIAAGLDREFGERPDNRRRAAAVLWATEYLLYVAGTDADDDLGDEEAILDTLIALWIGTLYGRLEEEAK